MEITLYTALNIYPMYIGHTTPFFSPPFPTRSSLGMYHLYAYLHDQILLSAAVVFATFPTTQTVESMEHAPISCASLAAAAKACQDLTNSASAFNHVAQGTAAAPALGRPPRAGRNYSASAPRPGSGCQSLRPSPRVRILEWRGATVGGTVPSWRTYADQAGECDGGHS